MSPSIAATSPRRRRFTSSISGSSARARLIPASPTSLSCSSSTRCGWNFSPPTRRKLPIKKGGEQPVGFKHLAFDVPKLEPAIEALKADGIVPDNIIDASKHIKGARIVFFRDPEGHIIELMENYFDEVA